MDCYRIKKPTKNKLFLLFFIEPGNVPARPSLGGRSFLLVFRREATIATERIFAITIYMRAKLHRTFSGAVKCPAPVGYFPLALIALRNCASASSLQYLQLSWRKTEV
jgi:hypothetical protein